MSHCTWPSKANLEQVTHKLIFKRKGRVCRKDKESLCPCLFTSRWRSCIFQEELWLSTADANDPPHCIPRPPCLSIAVTDSSFQVVIYPCQVHQVPLSLTASEFCPIMCRCHSEVLGTNAPGTGGQMPPPSSAVLRHILHGVAERTRFQVQANNQPIHAACD